MERELKTSDEIRAEIVRRVGERIRAMGGADLSSIGRPWLALAPDRDGCNWHVACFTNARLHRKEIAAVVADLRARWNLK